MSEKISKILKITVSLTVFIIALYFTLPAIAMNLSQKISTTDPALDLANQILADPIADSDIKESIKFHIETNSLDLERLEIIKTRLDDQVREFDKTDIEMPYMDYLDLDKNGFFRNNHNAEDWQCSFFHGFGPKFRVEEVNAYDSNFVLVAGNDGETGQGFLAIFDGVNWNMTKLDRPSGQTVGSVLRSSLIRARDDIYVGGNYGQIYHFDGQNWELQNHTAYPYQVYEFIENGDDIYVMIAQEEIWKQEGNEWVTLTTEGPNYCRYYNAKILNSELGDNMYILCENDQWDSIIQKINLETLNKEIFIEDVDDTSRFIYRFDIVSEDLLYFATGTVFGEQGTVLVLKWDKGEVSKIEGRAENAKGSLIPLKDMEKGANGEYWLSGEYGVIATMENEVIDVKPVDLNMDGQLNMEDWFNLQDIVPRSNELYLGNSLDYEYALFKVGEAVVPDILFVGLEESYSGGDVMNLQVRVDNTKGDDEELDLYVALEIPGNPALYYFWPSWGEFDSKRIQIERGETLTEDILRLTLPEDLGASGPYNFYALATAPDNFKIFSTIATGSFEFR
ncbi:hypothetical protein ACFL2B_02220 [Patescibacteria group bacterium]